MKLRKTESLIWLIFFPLMLSTIFYFAFNGLTQTETFEKSSVAIIFEGENIIFSEYFDSVADFEDENTSNALFSATIYETKEEGEKALFDGDVDSVFVVSSDDVSLLVTELQVDETVAKTFLDTFTANESTIKNIMQNGGNIEETLAILTSNQEIFERPLSDNKIDQMATYFFALIGMVCILFSNAGMEVIENVKVNQSLQAQRISLSSSSRIKIFFASYIGTALALIAIICMLMLHIGVILGINLGDIKYVLLTSLAGSFAGIGIGMLWGTISKLSSKTKESILTISTLFLSFLSGLMVAGVKELITNNVPILNYINPVALVADCFASLTYFNSFSEFWTRIIILFAIGLSTTIFSIINIRRKNYASI